MLLLVSISLPWSFLNTHHHIRLRGEDKQQGTYCRATIAPLPHAEKGVEKAGGPAVTTCRRFRSNHTTQRPGELSV